jgi:hypothetical protein
VIDGYDFAIILPCKTPSFVTKQNLVLGEAAVEEAWLVVVALFA